MTTSTRIFFTLFLLLLLSACGGSNHEPQSENDNALLKDAIPPDEAGRQSTNEEYRYKNGGTDASSPGNNSSNLSASGAGSAGFMDGNSVNGPIQADSTSTTLAISSSAAVENGKDTSHKFIRSADIRFRVKNVIKITYAIEDIVRHFGGFVTFTNLTSTIDNQNNTPVSEDSTLETINYTVANNMTIRVPNTNLDTVLKCIAPLIDYLDSRVIKANDIRLEMLTNSLTQKRIAKNEQRMINAIDNRGRKLGETTTAEDALISRLEQSDNAKIANLRILDQVDFSTINLYLYQRQVSKREMIANPKDISAYKPGLGSRIGDAFKKGWAAIEEIIVGLAQLWWVFLAAIVVLVVYKVNRSRKS